MNQREPASATSLATFQPYVVRLRLPLIVPVVGVVALLSVLLVNWEQFGYDRPLYSQWLLWLQEVVRPELVFGKWFYWATGLAFLVAELLWPARPVKHLAQLPWDVTSYVSGGLCYYLALLFFIVALPAGSPVWLGSAPSALRVLALFLVTDFLAYWTHRIRHTAPLWPVHRWHHAPEQLYWFSGNRTTPLDYLFLAAPSFFTFWAFNLSVSEGLFVVSSYTVLNHWMHANVKAGHRWLEWFVITPRFHRIHHSSAMEHYNSNYGVIFTFWDRLFGTFIDPDKTSRDFPIGLPARTAEKLRMMVGV